MLITAPYDTNGGLLLSGIIVGACHGERVVRKHKEGVIRVEGDDKVVAIDV